ncbi:MAG: sulfite exporter TauE/SafE family protein, partial [Calditrichia bacterium]
MLNDLLIFLLAIASSTASAVVGLGGGLLLIPFIVLIYGMHLKLVAGTMLFAMVPFTLVATLRNVKEGYVNFKIGLIMEIGSIIGVIIGSNFSTIIPNLYLKITLLVIVLYLIFTMRIPTDSSYNYVARGFQHFNFIPPFINCKTTPTTLCSIPALISVGLIAGFFAGLLGIGGGFLKTPVLIVGVLLPPKIAVGTSLFMILITAATGAVDHAILGHIYYKIGIIITVGMSIGALAGTALLKHISENRIKKYIVWAMLIAGI